MTKIALYLFVFAFSGKLLAQNETNYWFFSNNGGLHFTSSGPVPEPGSPMLASEGTSAISHPVTGNLLFYTDGMTVYDAGHNIMPNGTGLSGCPSTTQSALVVPKPGSNTIYYIFTNDCTDNSGMEGSRYSVVDMSLNGGMGDVVSKNHLLHAPCGEQLSAVKNSECDAWWIMTKEFDNNIYHAYLLTNAGIDTMVTSTIGLYPGTKGYGQAKFSPDGKKYAISTGNSTISGFAGICQLFDFDKATGLLGNPITLVHPSLGEDTYGLSFSGDNSKLYISRGTSNHLYQYDLSSGIDSTILASATMLGNLGAYNQFQLGPDHKLYLCDAFGYSHISVIHSPNLSGSACGLSMSSVPIAGNCHSGICNFPDSYFDETNACNNPVGLKITVHKRIIDTCGAGDTAWAWVSIEHGTAPFDISWMPMGSTNDTIAGLSPGTYTVTVMDSVGYTTTASISIAFSETLCPEVTIPFIIPNIITPNGDGDNDVFSINNLPPGSALQIFNRWGNRIFKASNYQNDWTGDTDGVYYYVLETSDGKSFSGFIQVIGK